MRRSTRELFPSRLHVSTRPGDGAEEEDQEIWVPRGQLFVRPQGSRRVPSTGAFSLSSFRSPFIDWCTIHYFSPPVR